MHAFLTMFLSTLIRTRIPSVNVYRYLGLSRNSFVRYLCTETLGEIKPIGYTSSLFCHQRGAPRQPTICPHSRATVTLDQRVVSNPQYTLEGLEEFSHVWLIFLFHKNKKKWIRSKVSPPRLEGKKVGVFSTRSPHRPNPIGLSLAKLDRVQGNTLYLSGIDLLDGTPILDVKPYIMEYDTPRALLTDHDPPPSKSDIPAGNDNDSSGPIAFGANKDSKTQINHKIPRECCIENCWCEEERDGGPATCARVMTPDWIVQPQSPKLEVVFTSKAHRQLQMFSRDAEDPDFSLKFLRNSTEASETISSILGEDPRPVGLRHRTEEKYYQFTVDNMCVTCLFSDGMAKVVKVANIKEYCHKKEPCVDILT